MLMNRHVASNLVPWQTIVHNLQCTDYLISTDMKYKDYKCVIAAIYQKSF